MSCVAPLQNIQLKTCSELKQFVCCVAANNLHRSYIHDEQSREAKQQRGGGSKKFHGEGRVLEMFCRRARAWVRSWSMLQRKPEAEHLERRNDGVAKRSNEWKYKMVEELGCCSGLSSRVYVGEGLRSGRLGDKTLIHARRCSARQSCKVRDVVEDTTIEDHGAEDD